MGLIQVDIVGPQSPQARIACLEDVPPGKPLVVGPWPTRIRHLVASTSSLRRPRAAASQPPITSSVNPAVSGSGGIG